LDAFFATNLGGTMSWGLKPCFSASESGFMTLYSYLPSNYQLVFLGVGISSLFRSKQQGGSTLL
jgi:hypothetical protein